jgi:hypothetical protein
MDQVSRPVQVLLAITVVFALVWFVALRPKGTSDADTASAPTPAAQDAPAAPGTEGLSNAVEQARGAASEANGDAQRAQQTAPEATGAAGAAGGTARAAPAPSTGDAQAKQPAPNGGADRPRAHKAAGPASAARAALRDHKALAIAFVDPFTADARAVEQELRHVSRFGGRAFLSSVPLADLVDYGFITRGVEVTVAPTVVIVAPNRTATTIVGFADRGEIEQRVADALTR